MNNEELDIIIKSAQSCAAQTIGQAGVETYGKAKEKCLRSFLELPNAISFTRHI